ncbi:related to actin cytoskeleton organization and biogenesis [Cephalotrichum gorgonifer]|uniref:Related to actin cytoskeleton organization and biogenesis n=1 Tax=Cephalotrichum gorgonifer TaxID=2041049 RepID=A0AAE8MV54_9PEZI|nr:related to actin cytoskeleton organization and biogenesis [Cephalotrichum gorgonifer]
MRPSTAGQATQGGYGYDETSGERGYRRRRLAAMAGSMYKAGASAVTEIRESYAQTRTAAFDPSENERPSIPGSFPDASITTTLNGREQMVLFPTYAKLHVKKQPRQRPTDPRSSGTYPDEESWNPEWEEEYDPNALVDVDVRGWIYSPLTGPLTRKNRIMMGLARQLSGIPRPDGRPGSDAGGGRINAASSAEDLRDQERIAAEAARIERRGQEERRVANLGEYSEFPGKSTYVPRNGSPASSNPPSPPLPARQDSAAPTVLSGAELAVANANLMARVAPFLTTPLSQLPITVFFYNESDSQSRTVMTNASGHFNLRAALPFTPTHVRVLANETLSAVQEVRVTESAGVSLISDIDDTIKRSNISGGTREIFRNTFVRELGGLTVDGIKEWYNNMYSMGVSLHYCSNSPWQLYPLLTTFFKMSGLPPGSMHLKAYSGMMQGIFEPVAERKKPTLERILNDFPERKFILVGDSGEADLEVYVELALANPGRILAIFIRDVTTPEQPAFFDSSFGAEPLRPGNGLMSGSGDSTKSLDTNDEPENRPVLPPRGPAGSRADEVPTGNLIDFSDDDTSALSRTPHQADISRPASIRTVPTARTPPPRPIKPVALRSNSMEMKESPDASGGDAGAGMTSGRPQPPPPRARKPVGAASQRTSPHPLSQSVSTSGRPVGDRADKAAGSNGAVHRSATTPSRTTNLLPPPPPPPRRNGTPSAPARGTAQDNELPTIHLQRRTTNFESPSQPIPTLQRVSSATTLGSQDSNYANANAGANAAVNKKLELWRRRLERAQDVLEGKGVALYTWRRGQDVMHEAEGIVRAALEGERTGKGGGKARG